MCAADFNDMGEFFGFDVQCIPELPQSREQRIADFSNGCDVHYCGKTVENVGSTCK